MLLLSAARKLGTQEELVKFVGEVHRVVPWRSYDFIDWNIWHTQFQPNPLGYVGLENLGNTSYINSLLQQLFAINSFKEAVLTIPNPQGTSNELQQVFGVLRERSCKYFCPRTFCSRVKASPDDSKEAKEFMTQLFTNLEDEFKGTADENLLDDLFGTSLSTRITCKNCDQMNETLSSPYVFQLNIDQHSTIVEGLQAYTIPEELKGESSLNCTKCGLKTEATKEVAIIKFPHYIFIELRRFVHEPTLAKLTKYCEFPFEIDMGHFSLKKTEAVYSLKGIVVHTGSAKKGRFCALTKSRKEPEEWLQFDGKKVTKVEAEAIPEKTFGSENAKEKKKSCACMLVYEKNSAMNVQKLEDDALLPEELQKRLAKINEVHLMKKYFFNSDYEFFILSLMGMHTSQDLAVVFKIFLTYYLTTAVHSKRFSEELYEILNLLKKWCAEGDMKLAKGVIATFAQTDFLNEFLIACPKEEPRRVIHSLIKAALQKYHHTEQSMLANPSKESPSLILALLHSLLGAMGCLPETLCGQYFQLLCSMAELDETLKSYLTNSLVAGAAVEVLGVVDSNECTMNLLKSFEDFKWKGDSVIDPLESKVPELDESDCLEQPKFPLALLKKLLVPSLYIEQKHLKEVLKVFQEPAGLTSLYAVAKTSKVAVNILSQVLKTLCDEEPDAYFTPITQYLHQKLLTENYSDLVVYFNTLGKLLGLKNEAKADELISAAVKTMGTGFEAQPYSVVISYIDFITAVTCVQT